MRWGELPPFKCGWSSGQQRSLFNNKISSDCCPFWHACWIVDIVNNSIDDECRVDFSPHQEPRFGRSPYIVCSLVHRTQFRNNGAIRTAGSPKISLPIVNLCYVLPDRCCTLPRICMAATKPAAASRAKRSPPLTAEQQAYLVEFASTHPAWDQKSVPADLNLARFQTSPSPHSPSVLAASFTRKTRERVRSSSVCSSAMYASTHSTD